MHELQQLHFERITVGKPCGHSDYQMWCRICVLDTTDTRYKSLFSGEYQRERIPDLRADGPGTELKLILEMLGVSADADCGCGSIINAMNQWGVDGCQKNRKAIEVHLRNRAAELGWVAKLKIAAAAIVSGMAFKLDPTNPSPGLLDEALRRAERKEKEAMAAKPVQWSYGITTCPQRRDNGLLERTIRSLALGGFDEPRLYVDGSNDCAGWGKWLERFPSRLAAELRYPALRVAGNWVLSLCDLYYRNPSADRFAVFQDDLVCSQNLRGYLNQCGDYPKRGYWNLYTFPENEELAKGNVGWFLSNQKGKGALALVFDRECVIRLLSSRHLAERPQDAKRGFRAIDGGVVTALAKSGKGDDSIREYCHSPSLVQHTGHESSFRPGGAMPFPDAPSFRGENFDLLTLLQPAK